uniref:SH3 domain-containing protein n=1 Tax=Heligmosomoides polygyrus TaxID=6339 RepID=A0A183FIV8_HELPZ
LDRLTNQLLVRLGVRTETLRKENAARLESVRTSSFSRVQECIEWVRVRLEKLSEMEFLEDLETLEEMFEQHKLDNRDIQDFRQNVDECIARQAEVSAEDTYEYCELLRVLESEYQQLRDLSAGRMLDLDSLIAFVRAAQMELVWVSEREEIEVTRNWSDIKQLDLPMLTNYYKQLLHEMELREKQYNDVHNQGAALLNQGHPAVHVIEVYLRTMQNQWDWLLSLSKCLEEHLRDALNLKSFTEEAADAEAWMEEQSIRLENNYNRTDFDLEEGERLLRELDEMKEILNKYHSVLMALTDRCATISPLWQRGERITRPITVTALCDYADKSVHIKAGDEVTLLDNSDLIKWLVRDLGGVEGTVPSVVFRIPPPDPKLTAYLNRLLQQFEKLKKLWEKKHRMVRFNMVLNTMKTIQGWDLDTFNAIDPEQRDAIMRALNDDANKLLAEMDPNDPLALRLKEELRRTNEHFWDLLNASQKPPEPDHSNLYDGQIGDLLRKLEDAWRKLNDNAGKPISRTPGELESVILDHKAFEDALQGLDADVSNVKELFRQLPNPTPTQRVNNDRLSSLWEDLHPDVDRVEDEVQQLNVRWENVCSQVADRLKAAERALQTQMVYRSEYESEMAWLDRVEETINKLRKPEELRPEQYQQQLDLLVAEYAQLQERTEAIENVNREGGKFIREAKGYDSRMGQFHDTIVGIHGPAIKQEFRRTKPQPKNGAQIVTEELEALNRRFAQLSSLILERRNTMQVLIQNWKRQKQEEEDRKKADEEAKRRAFEAARLKALEDADRLRKEREAAEAARRAAEEAERARRIAAELERARLAADEARRREEEERKRRGDEERERERRRKEDEDRRRREEEERERRRREEEEKEKERERERRRKEDEDRRRREDEERRRREEEERRRREEEERRKREEEDRLRNQKKMPPLNIMQGRQIHEVVGQENPDEFEVMGDLPDVAKITEHEDEMQMYQEETVTKTQFYEMEGTLHKQTGEILTFVEAVRQGLLDLSSGGGQFFDIHSGRISLEKAVELGYIDGAFNDVLNTRYGIRHPETGQELTLLEAIQIGLYDPQTRHLYDIHSGDVLELYDWVAHKIVSMETQRKLVKMGILKLPPMSLHSAIDQGVLNTVSGQFVGKYSHESMPIRDALYHGYLQLVAAQQIPMIAITLSDTIKQGFINANNGEFVDKNTNDTFTLRDACSKQLGLLNLYIPEVVNTADNTRLNLKDAMLRNAINTRNGNFTDLQTRRTLSLREAFQEDLISRPYSLTEMHENDLIDSTNHFIDRGTKHRHTILEAIAAGLLDAEVRHIVDPDEKDVISIAEAMERGILGADGKIILEKQQKEFTIPEAVREGLLTKRVRHSIFDVRGIQNTRTGQTMSFNEACEAGAIIPNAERVVDLATQDSYLISDEKSTAIIDKTLHELLVKPVGIRGDRGDFDMNIVRAVSKGIVDPTKGVFFNRNTKHEMTPREAYDAGLVSLRGAIQVAALFDVSPSLIAPVKKVEHKKRVSRPGQHGLELASDQVKVTLSEAMKQGLIDSRNQRFKQGDIDMSLDDALNQGLVDPSSEWIVPSKSNGVGPTIEEKTTESVTETGQQLAPKYYPDKNIEESVTTVKRVRTTETTALGGPGGVSVYRAITGGKGAMEVPGSGYHIYEAERKGIIDLSTGNITSPNVDRAISFADGIELGIIDAASISVKDPKTGRMLNVKEALEKNIIDKDGSVTHHGRSLNIEKAVEAGVIVIDAEAVVPASGMSKNIIHIPPGGGPVISFRPVGAPVVEESEQSWSFDSTKGVLVDHMSGERLTLEQALLAGKIQAEDLAVRDALTGREMSFTEAEKWGIVDKRGYYLDKIDNKRLSFTEAAQQHRIYPTGGVLDNAGDAVHTSVKVQTRTQVAKKQATATGAPQIDNTLGKALSLGWYNASDGMFTHPDTQRQMTLKEAIIKGLFNPYDTNVVDKKRNKTISLLEAIQEGIVDDTAGTVTDTETQKKHDLNSALRNGLLEGKNFADSLESGLFSGRLDLATGSYTQPSGAAVPLHEALKKNLVDQDSIVVRDPASGTEYSYHEAVTRRIVDPERGLIHNKQTNEATSFPQALTTGVIAGAGSAPRPSHSTHKIVEQKLQLTPFAPQQVSLRQSGSDRHEYVDLGGGKQVMVKVVRGEGGVEKGEYVDPSTGMKFTIQMHGDPFVTETKTTVKSTSQVQSVELEPHAEFVGIDRIRDKRNGRTMSLEDAKRIGLARVDKKGKQMTKTYSVFRSNIQNALNNGVLDAHMEKISLEDAIRAGIIDIRELSYRNPKSGESIPLAQAANMGLVDVTLAETLPKGVCNPTNAERIPIKRAIEMGIIDARTGEVRDPHTRKRLTWLDIIKSVYQAITSDGVFDPTKGQRVPVTHALNEGLVNTKTGKYHNPITSEDIELKDAVDRGLIDSATYEALTKPFLEDYRTHRQLNLIEAVDAKLIDPKNKTIQLSRQSIVPIAKAVEDGRIPIEIGEKLRQIDKLNFAEALGKGLIDVTSNIFTDADTGRQMTIAQAIEKGYIDTGNVEAMEGSDEKNLSNVINSEEFDENSGRIRDKRTSLHLTFKDAVERDVIDGDSLLHDLESGQTLTLREALVRKKIDNDGKFIAGNLKMTLRDAVKSGLLALIASPMQAAQAVAEAVKRRDAEGYKFKIENYGGDNRGSRTSVPKFREETIVRLTPQKAEPSLTVRMRHSQTNVGDRARSFIDDPSTLADLQHEFLANLEASRFDTDEKVITNPSGGQRLSVREAAETGLLDVLTGEIVVPETGRRYSIPKAVHLNYVQGDAAKRLMESLNMSIEEVNLAQQQSTSAPSPGGTEPGVSTRTWTKTVNWHGQPSELRKSRTDPLAPYTTITSSSTERTSDAPAWAR